MADPNYINSQSVDWNKFYSGIVPQTPAMQTSGWGKPVGSTPSYLRQGVSGVNFNPGVGFVPGAIPTDRLPQGTAGLPNPSPGSGLTPQQLAAMGGWTTDPLTGQLSYSQPSQNGAVNAINGATQNVPLPRPRPPTMPGYPTVADYSGQSTQMEDALIQAGVRPGVPWAQQGANPGMGGALIGNGVMSPNIPPQQPPADGSSPLPKWRGDIFGPMGGPSGRTDRTGSAGGYQYVNGQKVGYAPINVGRGSYTPRNGAAAYALANLGGQQAALQRQANATGVAGAYQYQNGQRVGQNPAYSGMSPSDAYSAANSTSRLNAIANSNLSDAAKKRASSGGGNVDANGLTENGNPGWWGS